jgi:hypothetical protein
MLLGSPHHREGEPMSLFAACVFACIACLAVQALFGHLIGDT